MGLEDFEMRLVKKGIKRGYSPDLLFNSVRARRILASPASWLSRRFRARKAQQSSSLAGFVPDDTGYAMLDKGDLPGMDPAIKAAREIYEAAAVDHRKSAKPFFSNILRPEHVEAHPALMEFATSNTLQEIVACYFRSWPALHTLGIFVSPPTNTQESSQNFHVDTMDKRLLKCFVNVIDVGPENGPFTFIPADKSKRIRAALGHRWGSGSLTDEEILSQAAPDDIISLTGPAGTAALVDTARCLHFGSRCREGVRVVIMVNYARVPNLAKRKRTDKKRGAAMLLGGH